MSTYVPLNINDEPATNEVYPATNEVYPATNEVYPATNEVYPVTNEVYPATNEVYPATESPQQQTAPSVEQPPTMLPELRVGKSAVSELHEMAVQIGETLSWVQESECGPAHCKLFSMKVTMGTYEATGSGRSKRIAKQLAAQTLLTKMNEMSTTQQGTSQQGETGQEYGPQQPQGNQTEHHTLLGNTGTTSKVATGNPVSKLQNIAVKHGLGAPEYQVVNEDGAHALQRFDIKVKVKELESSGLGRSKKTAKRNAAQAMLDQLSKTNTSIAPPIKRMTFVPAVNTEGNNGAS